MKCLTFLCLFCSLNICAAGASAAMYSFTNIIDSTVAAQTGNYRSFSDAAISGNTVAFKAGHGPGDAYSILTSSGGPRTQVARTLMTVPSGTVDTIGRPSIEGQNVYFDARVLLSLLDFGDGVFSGYGQRHVNGSLLVNTLVSPRLVSWAHAPKVVADPLISQGFLSYLGLGNTIGVRNPERTFARIVGVGDAAPPGGTFSSIDANYGLSGGTAAFRGVYGSQEGIFTGAGGPLTTIAKKGDPTPSGEVFNSVLDPAISGTNVAFLGAFAGGSGIFTGNGGVLSTIVKTGDATPSGNLFSGFSVPAITFNMLAFRGEYTGGGGIYTKSGDELGKVVEIGDSLFGSTVASLNFSDLGLDRGGSGNLAFNYGLADGRTGVAMAVPGPGLPTIYQRNGLPVLDSVGIVWVPFPNFEGRNLTNANLGGADLRNVNARNVNLTDGWLKQSDLTRADLRDANLSGAIAEAAVLTGANLNGADVIGANFDRLFSTTTPICNSGGCFNFNVVIHGSGITPAQLYGTTTYQAHDLRGISFEGNSFTSANLVGQNLAGANFTYATLTGADLTDAEIRGANFGRYWLSTEAQCVLFGTCTLTTGIIGSGITAEQLYSTASYKAHDLTGIHFGGNSLAGANLAAQNLSRTYFSGDLLHGSPSANLESADLSHAILHNANFRGARLAGANLTGADARRALLTNAILTDAVLTNFIQSDGHISGLDLGTGETLLVRDCDCHPANGTTPLPITVDQHFAMSDGGTLRTVFEADAWDSTISFAAGIPVSLGGELELAFAAGVDPATQIGRTFDLFDWSGVTTTGAFNVVSDYSWDTSQLYTSGDVTLIPEPATLAFLAAVGLIALCVRRALGVQLRSGQL